MIGTTGLQGLQVDCIVGIHPHERETRQSVILDIDLDYDFASAATADTIGDAVDYSPMLTVQIERIRDGSCRGLSHDRLYLLERSGPGLLTLPNKPRKMVTLRAFHRAGWSER